MLVGKEHMFLNAELQKERTVIMEHTFDDVLKAFEGYIRSSSYMDICKTKFGYAVLHFNPGTNSFIYEPEILETPEDMVRCLREEIVLDVLRDTDHDLEEATEEELNEIRIRIEPYMETLNACDCTGRFVHMHDCIAEMENCLKNVLPQMTDFPLLLRFLWMFRDPWIQITGLTMRG